MSAPFGRLRVSGQLLVDGGRFTPILAFPPMGKGFEVARHE